MRDTKMDDILDALPWRCLFCDFVTSDRAEAEAHFGARDDGEEFKPICKWWDSLAADEKLKTLQDVLKQLAAEQRDNARLRTAVEGLEYQVDGFENCIKSYAPFRQCR